MNPVVETMLKDLIAETEQDEPGAVYTVLSLLYGHYLSGMQDEFARHCCEFPRTQMTMPTTVRQRSGNALS